MAYLTVKALSEVRYLTLVSIDYIPKETASQALKKVRTS